MPALWRHRVGGTSSWLPPGHLLSRAQSDWCDLVTQATQQRVKCNILPKPVTPPPGTFDAVRDGLADLSFSVHGYTPGRYVVTKMAEMPFLGDSPWPPAWPTSASTTSTWPSWTSTRA
jgi:TRAP-type transport system periplasmic protein